MRDKYYVVGYVDGILEAMKPGTCFNINLYCVDDEKKITYDVDIIEGPTELNK